VVCNFTLSRCPSYIFVHMQRKSCYQVCLHWIFTHILVTKITVIM